MNRIMVAGLALVLLVAVPFTVLGQPRGGWHHHAWSRSGYVVNNGHHSQALGGHSFQACRGLAVAAGRSPVVTPPATPPLGGGDKGGDTSKGGGSASN
jgi:hypothetical protein